MPAVTVAIVSWNTRDLLRRCLMSFQADADRGLAEVWVVDNASSDGSAELVRDEFPWVRLIASEENLGFGPALNRVADATDTPWLIVSNADVELHPGALDVLLETAARDPGAGAIAPRLMLLDGRPQHSVGAFPTITFTLLHAIGAFSFNSPIADRFAFPGRWDMDRRRRIPWAVGAFLLVRREAWDAVGGFDEQQWMYAEDVDFCWRLAQAGWATRYEPLALVEHVEAAATSQHFGGERAPVWQRATYGCIARRKGLGYARVVALIYLFNVLSRTPAVYARSRDARWMRGAHRRWIATHLWALDPRRDLRRVR
jgi:GT2 family glycosyltransferase